MGSDLIMSVTVSNRSASCGMGCDSCDGSCGKGLRGLGQDFSFFDPNYPSSMPNDPVVTQNGSQMDNLFDDLWSGLPSASASAAKWNPLTLLDSGGFFIGDSSMNVFNPNVGAGNNNGGGSGLWQTLLAGTASTFNSIARSRYGVPPPGTYITQGANGSMSIQRLPEGANASAFSMPSLGLGGMSLTTMLMLGGVAYLLLKK